MAECFEHARFPHNVKKYSSTTLWQIVMNNDFSDTEIAHTQEIVQFVWRIWWSVLAWGALIVEVRLLEASSQRGSIWQDIYPHQLISRQPSSLDLKLTKDAWESAISITSPVRIPKLHLDQFMHCTCTKSKFPKNSSLNIMYFSYSKVRIIYNIFHLHGSHSGWYMYLLGKRSG